MLLVERCRPHIRRKATLYVPAFTGPGADAARVLHVFPPPAGGLVSTPEDFAVICALMLGGGKWGDVRLLSPATVRVMTSNRLNDLPDLPEPVRRTQPWGLGWRLNHLGMADSWGDLLGRHVFGHTGSVGNVVWMDPQT